MKQTLLSLLRLKALRDSVAVNLVYLTYSLLRNELFVDRPVTRVRDLADSKRSDTLLILGAGSSINELSKEQWKSLEAFDVAGISYSVLLPIHKTFYFYETPREESLIKNHRQRLLPLILARHREGNVGHILWKNPLDAPESLRTLLVAFARMITINLMTQEPRSLIALIRLARSLGLIRRVMFQARGSVFTLALFGVALGYRRLVFCGVDLNGSPYFFENIPEFQERGLPNPVSLSGERPAPGHHPTSDPAFGMPMELALAALRRATGVECLVTSMSSRLAGQFPVWTC